MTRAARVQPNPPEATATQKSGWSCPDRADLPVPGPEQLPLPTLENDNPFAVPARLDDTLTQVLAYWNGLKRGNAEMPFADDVKLGDIWKLSNSIVLVHVLPMPHRFRLEIAGRQLIRMYGEDVAGRFADEIAVRPPLDFFLSQCSAATDARAPTFYRHPATADGHGAYARILLPLWGDGRIVALLGAVSNA
ncbi:MAG TPA: hypothetical protein VHT51_12785 [Micropepsaceae bacterium]|jgi:hypothetical protein|nr:hypothetical protein [Micropepsaceae bacterium]